MDPQTGDLILAVSDHLDWDENEGEHLFVLQDKLNTYLEYIEGGQSYTKVPRAVGRKIVIRVFGKFTLSEEGRKVYQLTGKCHRRLRVRVALQAGSLRVGQASHPTVGSLARIARP